MRLGLIAEMSPRVREKIFRSDFPVYPYMYTLRQLHNEGFRILRFGASILVFCDKPVRRKNQSDWRPGCSSFRASSRCFCKVGRACWA
jgi:hypothetical protein